MHISPIISHHPNMEIAHESPNSVTAVWKGFQVSSRPGKDRGIKAWQTHDISGHPASAASGSVAEHPAMMVSFPLEFQISV